MSRSIHTTRRHLEETQRDQYADPQQGRAHIKRLQTLLDQKRATKAQVRQARRQPLPLLQAPLTVEQIPILVLDQHACIHYPASVEDLRAVLRRLPPGTLDGVRRILLCLGAQEQDQAGELEETPFDRDPFLGRSSVEIVPGVFVGRCLGTYVRQDATIRLYAYVYDAALPERERVEVYLRLMMLATLVHEVAHHTQKRAQGTRGRWFAQPGKVSERYAERREYRWGQQIIAPYLEQAYPEPVRALYAWMAYHGGVTVSLATLAEAPKQPGLFSTAIAFESLVEAVHNQQSLKESRLGFAQDLSHADHPAEALQSIARVLAEHPQDAEALLLQAHIFNRQGRYAEAGSIAQTVLAQDETNVQGWEELSEVYSAQGNWPAVEQATTRVIELGKPPQVYALGDRARARVELGLFQAAAADMAVLSQIQARGSLVAKMVAVLEALVLLRTGHAEEALAVAKAGLQHRWHTWRWILVAVRFEAAHRLGRREEAGELTTSDLTRLREDGYGAWADHLTFIDTLRDHNPVNHGHI